MAWNRRKTMGDRCYVTIRCRKADLEKHWPEDGREYGPATETELEGGAVELSFEEVNYADLRVEGFPEAIPFIGSHSSGGEYGACELVHDGRPMNPEGVFATSWEQGHDGGYVFEVYPDTGAVEHSPAWVEYWAYRERVRRYIDEGVPLD